MGSGWALLREIINGYRMEKPKFSPNFIGEMMKNCWQKEPTDRPTFSQLAEVIEKQIESVVGFDYFNMNEPINKTGMIEETEVDPTQTNRLEIVKSFNEATQSQPPEGAENSGFFDESQF